MDKIPSSFETWLLTIITKCGSREVLLQKGDMFHKYFTITFTIALAGEILKPHVLFSKLKNKPTIDP